LTAAFVAKHFDEPAEDAPIAVLQGLAETHPFVQLNTVRQKIICTQLFHLQSLPDDQREETNI
jgi:hypothetical protein